MITEQMEFEIEEKIKELISESYECLDSLDYFADIINKIEALNDIKGIIDHAVYSYQKLREIKEKGRKDD